MLPGDEMTLSSPLCGVYLSSQSPDSDAGVVGGLQAGLVAAHGDMDEERCPATKGVKGQIEMAPPTSLSYVTSGH